MKHLRTATSETLRKKISLCTSIAKELYEKTTDSYTSLSLHKSESFGEGETVDLVLKAHVK